MLYVIEETDIRITIQLPFIKKLAIYTTFGRKTSYAIKVACQKQNISFLIISYNGLIYITFCYLPLKLYKAKHVQTHQRKMLKTFSVKG